MNGPRRLSESFVHLGLGATAVPQPPFDGMEWYEAYGARHAADGREGRLVSQYTFDEDWTVWEMHPSGDELVLCIDGEMILHQEFPDGRTQTVTICAGEYIINPPHVWHTADVKKRATAVFVTAGEGTQHRLR